MAGRGRTDLTLPLLSPPRAGGSCFRECGGRALLTNVSSVALGSRRFGGLLPAGGGAARAGPGLSYCVWVVSATEVLQPCAPGTLCPPLTLTFSPDSSTPCTVSTKGARDRPTFPHPGGTFRQTLAPMSLLFQPSNSQLYSSGPYPSVPQPTDPPTCQAASCFLDPSFPFPSPGMVNVCTLSANSDRVVVAARICALRKSLQAQVPD